MFSQWLYTLRDDHINLPSAYKTAQA